MAEPPTEHRPAPSTLKPLVVGVSVVLWMVGGAFVGYVACWVVALSDIFPLDDPEHGPARIPVGEHVYAGVLIGGVILGLACFCLRPRLHRGDHRLRDGRLPNEHSEPASAAAAIAADGHGRWMDRESESRR